MKRLLCIALTLVCLLAIASCELLKTPDSSGTVNTTTLAPTETTPDATTPETTTPETTTPEKTPNATTPEKTPEATTPEKAPDETKPENPPAEELIAVRVKFKSGGIHEVEETLKVETPCTFNQVYSEFVKKHYLETFSLIPHLNGEVVDINEIIYLQDGDYIYLEEYSGMPGEGPVCPHVWISGSCEKCGAVCEHNEWDDNRQCLVCGAMLGVDMLHFEIYENGEYQTYLQGIETTLRDLALTWYGYYPWEYLEANYEFYFNGVLITDGSYPITESGRLELISRTYE